MLAYDRGEIVQDGNVSINLSVTDMLYTEIQWGDPVAGIFVDNNSTYTQNKNATLRITTESLNQAAAPYGEYFVPVAAISAGITMPQANETSTLTLSGNTILDIGLSNQAKETSTAGLMIVGGAKAIVDGALSIYMNAPEGAVDSYGDFAWTAYGIAAGTWVPGRTLSTGYGGSVEVTGALTILPPDNYSPALTDFVALYANGSGGAFGSYGGISVDNRSTGAPVNIVGFVKTEKGGLIDLNLSGKNASWIGAASSERSVDWYTKVNDGKISVNLSDGASWTVLDVVERDKDGYYSNDGESQVYDVALNNGGILNLQTPSSSDLPNYTPRTEYQSVKVWNNLSGEQGIIGFDMDLANESIENVLTDQLIVQNEASGTHSVSVNFVNGLTSVPADKWHSENWLISQEAGDMTLTGPDGRSEISDTGMVSVWNIKFVPEGQESLLDTDRESLSSTSSGKGDWYLVRNDEELPPEVVDNITIGTSASQALAYMADLEDLRKRLGEVRYGAQAGAWVKAFAKKDNVSTSGSRGFEQDVYGINVGLDALVGTSESASWLVGGAFRYARADQEGIGIAATSGDLDEYSIKAYATWMHEKGSYADFVLQAGRYEQELSGIDNSGTGSSRADYGTWGFGASVEIGHMFSFGDNVDDRRWFNHWFVEPQLELSYFHARGADYSTSTGLRVNQDNADFLTGRAGLVLGKKFNYGSVNELDRRFFQFALIGGVKHEFLGGDQTIRYTGVDGAQASVHADDIDGSRFYYGLNFDWQVSNSCRLYAQLDREEGDHYTKEYDVSVGLKWTF